MNPVIRYLVLWWEGPTENKRLLMRVFEQDSEATLFAKPRNAVVVELIGERIVVGRVEDYWRRDDEGRPMPAERRAEK